MKSFKHKQKGAALVTAMLLTFLSIASIVGITHLNFIIQKETKAQEQYEMTVRLGKRLSQWLQDPHILRNSMPVQYSAYQDGQSFTEATINSLDEYRDLELNNRFGKEKQLWDAESFLKNNWKLARCTNYFFQFNADQTAVPAHILNPTIEQNNDQKSCFEPRSGLTEERNYSFVLIAPPKYSLTHNEDDEEIVIQEDECKYKDSASSKYTTRCLLVGQGLLAGQGSLGCVGYNKYGVKGDLSQDFPIYPQVFYLPKCTQDPQKTYPDQTCCVQANSIQIPDCDTSVQNCCTKASMIEAWYKITYFKNSFFAARASEGCPNEDAIARARDNAQVLTTYPKLDGKDANNRTTRIFIDPADLIGRQCNEGAVTRSFIIRSEDISIESELSQTAQTAKVVSEKKLDCVCKFPWISTGYSNNRGPICDKPSCPKGKVIAGLHYRKVANDQVLSKKDHTLTLINPNDPHYTFLAESDQYKALSEPLKEEGVMEDIDQYVTGTLICVDLEDLYEQEKLNPVLFKEESTTGLTLDRGKKEIFTCRDDGINNCPGDKSVSYSAGCQSQDAFFVGFTPRCRWEIVGKGQDRDIKNPLGFEILLILLALLLRKLFLKLLSYLPFFAKWLAPVITFIVGAIVTALFVASLAASMMGKLECTGESGNILGKYMSLMYKFQMQTLNTPPHSCAAASPKQFSCQIVPACRKANEKIFSGPSP